MEQSETARRVGVVDIGSNSVRLVAFDLRQGLPLPIFNEKATCRLGQGLDKTGRLDPGRMRGALELLNRFAILVRALELEEVFLLATAATRDASNGATFVREVEHIFETPVQVLSGEEEARTSALGVLAGLPGAHGVAGDLGGGSLELIGLDGGQLGAAVSLPLGPLRLIDQADGDLTAATTLIDARIGAVDWLGDALGGRTLYVVGGAWRALARIQMAPERARGLLAPAAGDEEADASPRRGPYPQRVYPLRMIHGFTLPYTTALVLTTAVAGTTPQALAKLTTISRSRLETLPWAALVLKRLIELGRPAEVCFSANGLREGFLFARSPAHRAGHDPLAIATGWLAQQSEQAPAMTRALERFTDAVAGVEEPGEARLRKAACALSSLAWAEHPDYRAEQAFTTILHSPSLPLRHPERAWLALAVLHRYGGGPGTSRSAGNGTDNGATDSREGVSATDWRALEVQAVEGLLSPESIERAQTIGQALRLAHRVSGGALPLLEAASLEVKDKRLVLHAAPALAPSDAVARDLATLAKLLGLKPSI